LFCILKYANSKPGVCWCTKVVKTVWRKVSYVRENENENETVT
jgi:hypothetical protein